MKPPPLLTLLIYGYKEMFYIMHVTKQCYVLLECAADADCSEGGTCNAGVCSVGM